MRKMGQRAALNVILAEEGHGGLSPAAVELHKQQCEDFEKMEKRMSDIENKVDNLNKKMDNLDNKFDELKELVTKRNSFKESLKDILSNRIFIYLLMILIAVKYGIPVAEVGNFLFK